MTHKSYSILFDFKSFFFQKIVQNVKTAWLQMLFKTVRREKEPKNKKEKMAMRKTHPKWQMRWKVKTTFWWNTRNNYLLKNYRPHSEGMGKVLFSQVCVCSHFGGGTPIQLMGSTHILPDWGCTPSIPTGGTPILPDREGTPIPGQDRGSTPIPDQEGGLLHPRSGWGVPPPPPVQVRSQVRMGEGGTSNQNSTACTFYAAGGMPLAFTQEDFLVKIDFMSSRHKIRNLLILFLPYFFVPF